MAIDLKAKLVKRFVFLLVFSYKLYAFRSYVIIIEITNNIGLLLSKGNSDRKNKGPFQLKRTIA
ncbi:hypothetical protein ES703_71125 [subsurface metagenome]